MPCTGTTTNNIVCGKCRPGGCMAGEYISSQCNGSTTKDTTECMPCSCPAGSYALNNTCTGTTESNTLACASCRLPSTCIANKEYLSGSCSSFYNPQCLPCRSQCGASEIEVQPCTQQSDRRCLPNPSCFFDCPAGTYEARACNPPAITQASIHSFSLTLRIIHITLIL